MTEPGPGRPTKGFFAKIGLPVARSYIYPRERNRLLAIGAFLGLAGVLLLAGDLLFFRGGLVSSGPLSSSHAGFEGDCASCHTRFEPMNDDKCSACHEAYDADVGALSFDAHYVYRSEDLNRAFAREDELPCFGCHREHEGREADISAISDALCQRCHDFGGFSEHPPFEHGEDGLEERPGILFAHVPHLKRVMERDEIENVEEACLRCHEPRDDGDDFEPLDFVAQCSGCHLGRGIASNDLPVGAGPMSRDAGDGVAIELGAETLATIRARQGPGERWALYENPNEFREDGGRVSKTRLTHEDPWILHNLNRVRSALYPSLGLAALLKASPELPARDSRVLYEEALDTLRDYAEGLRGTSDRDLQRELAGIDAMLGDIEKKLDDPRTPLDGAEFLLVEKEDPRLSGADIEGLLAFATEIAGPCLQCHTLRNGAISRVQKSQRTLDRAEFRHRPHIMQRRCWDCHSQIPLLEGLDAPDNVDPAQDRAEILNLPGIETCQECHDTATVTSQCSSCHLFHPGESIHTRLLLRVDER